MVESQNNRVILCQNPQAPVSLSKSPRTPSDLPPFPPGLVPHPLSTPCPGAASHAPSCASAGHVSSCLAVFALAALHLQGPSDLLSPFLRGPPPRDPVSASQTTAFTLNPLSGHSPSATLTYFLLGTCAPPNSLHNLHILCLLYTNRCPPVLSHVQGLVQCLALQFSSILSRL